jgi:hypothetical protein
MTKSPWKTGAALAVTVAVSYAVCTVLFVLWPDRGIEFMNGLAHGLDFAKLISAAPLSISQFYYPFAVLVVWAFAMGTLFAWLRDLFNGRR